MTTNDNCSQYTIKTKDREIGENNFLSYSVLCYSDVTDKEIDL